MVELPKSVLQRLRASAPPGEHPAADLLAAFAEQSLASAEREQLLAHLANCEPCRAAVFYALPESEESQTVTAGVRGRSWSMAWRWAGVAAGVVVLAGVAMLFRGGPGPAAEKAAVTQSAPVVAEQRETPAPQIKQPASAPSAETRLQARNAPARAVTGARLDKQAAAGPEGGVAGGVVAMNEASKESPINAEAAQGQIGGVSGLAKSSDQIALKDEARAEGAPAPAPPAAPAANTISAAKAAPAAPASTAVAGVMIASNINARDMGKKKLAPPTRWMLSPAGALLRSTDAGGNWQTVPFGNVVFRAVAVVGTRVWAGGQGGALYYSADDGSQWQRLQVAGGGVALTDDISSLTFHDRQHGSLTTAAGQTWNTSDGGQSWQKQ